MRAFMQFGLPLNVNGTRYKGLSDRKDEQKKYIGDFQNKIVTSFEKYDKETSPVFPTIVSEEVT